MVRKIALLGASIAIAAVPQTASADSATFRLSARVAVECTVQHQPSGYGEISGGTVALGEIREFCNARNGYELLVDYTPGSLRGTTIRAGEDEAVLDGSGEAVLSRAPGPRIRTRVVTAEPGKAGFDAGSIRFRVVPA